MRAAIFLFSLAIVAGGSWVEGLMEQEMVQSPPSQDQGIANNMKLAEELKNIIRKLVMFEMSATSAFNRMVAGPIMEAIKANEDPAMAITRGLRLLKGFLDIGNTKK